MTTTTAGAIDVWRPFKTDPAAWYSADDMAKADAYQKPLRRVMRLRSALVLAATFALVFAHPLSGLLRAWGIHNWVLQLAVVTAALQLVESAIQLPFSAWRELGYDKRWGFSNQTVKGFVIDAVKMVPIGLVLTIVIMTPLWAVIRATEAWWLLGAGLFAFLVIGLGILFPVVIFPLFNKYTPLEEGELRTAIFELARQRGADIKDVLVEDSSKRDTRPNAYVAGIGKIRRVVIFDNMLRYPTDAVLSVVAHEIGHWKMRHLVKTIPVQLAAIFAGFGVLHLLLGSTWLLHAAGVKTLADPAASLLFQLVFFTLLGPAIGLIGSWVGRAFERQADIFGMETIGHADGLVDFFRDVSLEMKADLRPSWWHRVKASHPPFAERMAMATAWAASRRATSSAPSGRPREKAELYV